MNRRKFLNALVTLPFIGCLFESERAEAIPSRERLTHQPGGPYRTPEDRIKTDADLLYLELLGNLNQYYAETNAKHSKEFQISEHEMEIFRKICKELCSCLLEDDVILSEVNKYYPDFDTSRIRDVEFRAMRGPVDVIEGADGRLFPIQAAARKIKVMWNPDMYKDILCPDPCLDPEKELIEYFAYEAALDILTEIAADHTHGGRDIRVYAIYLPPFNAPPVFAPADFSVNRRPRIRYAKL